MDNISLKLSLYEINIIGQDGVMAMHKKVRQQLLSQHVQQILVYQ